MAEIHSKAEPSMARIIKSSGQSPRRSLSPRTCRDGRARGERCPLSGERARTHNLHSSLIHARSSTPMDPSTRRADRATKMSAPTRCKVTPGDGTRRRSVHWSRTNTDRLVRPASHDGPFEQHRREHSAGVRREITRVEAAPERKVSRPSSDGARRALVRGAVG